MCEAWRGVLQNFTWLTVDVFPTRGRTRALLYCIVHCTIMIDCGCVFLKRKNPCVTILYRPLHNNLWLWFDFLKEEDAICGSTVSYIIKYGFTVIGFSQRERNQERRSDPYVIISYRMLQGRKDQWTMLLYSLIRCKIMNYCECLFLTILLYRKQNKDWQFVLEWSRNKLDFSVWFHLCT